MKVSDLINLLQTVQNTKGDLEIRLCELQPDENYTPLFTSMKIMVSNDFTDKDIDIDFLDKDDVCKDGREFLFFDCQSNNNLNVTDSDSKFN